MADIAMDENNQQIGTNNTQRLTFLDLPTELRVIIYNYLFSSLTRTVPTLPTDNEISHITSLLYTSRFIFNEAGDIFVHYEYDCDQVVENWLSYHCAALQDRFHGYPVVHSEWEVDEVMERAYVWWSRITRAVKIVNRGGGR